MNPHIGEQASAGGHAKQAARQTRADEILATLPPLDSPGGPERWLEAAARLSFEGCLAGAQAGAIVRAVEVYVKSQTLQNDVRRIKELEASVAALEKELAKREGGKAKRAGWSVS